MWKSLLQLDLNQFILNGFIVDRFRFRLNLSNMLYVILLEDGTHKSGLHTINIEW